jgi:hypothetical protein
VLDEITELRAALASLPGVVGGVSLRPDTSDPERQGGELLHLGLELIPVALESLLVLVQSWRERRRKSEGAADGAAMPAAISINLTIKGPSTEVHLEIDGSQDQALPAATSILAQLTGTVPAAEQRP